MSSGLNLTFSNFQIITLSNFFVMPKVKTNAGAKKRFRLTGTGKIKRKYAFKNHILTKKSKKRKRKLGLFTLVSNSDKKRVKLLLNI